MAYAGLELNERRMRELQTASDNYLEVLSTEYHSGLASAPQALPGPEKETTVVDGVEPVNEEANASLEVDNSAEASKSTRPRRFWLFLALAAITVIVVAITVPVAIKHRRRFRYEHGRLVTDVYMSRR